ncbi:hypothetical protein WA158_004049 [Blastocystis sp. Blastoise]
MRAAGSKIMKEMERSFSSSSEKFVLPKENIVKAARTKPLPTISKTVSNRTPLLITSGVIGTVAAIAGYEAYETQKKFKSITVENYKQTVAGTYHELMDPIMYKLKQNVLEQNDNRLPDPYVPDNQKAPRTLIIRLQHGVTGEVFNPNSGLRSYKRANFDQFLLLAAADYEIVFACDESKMISDDLIHKVDPLQLPYMSLYEDGWKSVEGKKVRDINTINRDPKNIIIIDIDENHFVNNENMLVIPEIEKVNPKKDTSLLDIIPILQDIVEQDVEDTREYIKKIGGSKNYNEGFKELVKERQLEKEKARAKRFAPQFEQTNFKQEKEDERISTSLPLDVLRYGAYYINSPDIIGLLPMMVYDQANGKWIFNVQLTEPMKDLNEDELESYCNVEKISGDKSLTIWQKKRIEKRIAEFERAKQPA